MLVDSMDAKKGMAEAAGYPNGKNSHRNDCHWLQRLGDCTIAGGGNSLTRAADMPHPPTLLDLAKRGNQDAFRHLAEPYRPELQVHCYWMLGSFHDAEDVVQETFLRAWRGLRRFQGRASFRGWLYRIATNACLNAIASRASARRVLPEAHGPPADQMPTKGPTTEIAWLEPDPDAALEGIADAAPHPNARYEMVEAVQLAFVAAIQHLPPRQRAVLLLRDVLSWSAAETARTLDASVASVNSALQRARATLAKEFPAGRPSSQALPDDQQRALLERYVRSWQSADLDGFVALLKEEAVLSMPRWKEWYAGREAIRAFFAWAWKSMGPGPFRLIATAANRQPAFALYVCDQQESQCQAHAIQLLTLKDDAIARLTLFLDPRLFAAFGLPASYTSDLRITSIRVGDTP
jgi:RNA polymerase sigma-70 factor, ECF subfamily